MSANKYRTINKKNTLRENILAVRVIAETIKTTLGPKGLQKMLISDSKDISITDKGSTILSRINIQHPVAKLVVEASLVMEKEDGDGTSSVVILVGELLKKAEELLDQGLHPTVIAEGYRIAHENAQRYLDNASFPLTEKNILDLASTMIEGKISEKEVNHLSNLVVNAVTISKKVENIKVVPRPGGNIGDSQLIEGVIIDLGKRINKKMPSIVKNGRILLIDTDFVVKPVKEIKIKLQDPRNIGDFMDYKSRVLRIAVDMIVKSRANVVFSQKNIEELAGFFLSEKGILAVRDVDKDILTLLSKATGGRIVGNVKDIDSNTLGYAGIIMEKKMGLEEIMYILNCRNHNITTILVRGGSEIVTLEISRRTESMVSVISKAFSDKRCVPGGGACEIGISRYVRDYALEVKRRHQLAINAYADALESIPKALALNAGIEPLHTLAKLRKYHRDNKQTYGLDVRDGKLKHSLEAGIIESFKSKKHALSIASELVNMILRIDEVLIAKGPNDGEKVQEPQIKAPSIPEGAVDFPAKGNKIDFRGLMT